MRVNKCTRIHHARQGATCPVRRAVVRVGGGRLRGRCAVRVVVAGGPGPVADLGIVIMCVRARARVSGGGRAGPDALRAAVEAALSQQPDTSLPRRKVKSLPHRKVTSLPRRDVLPHQRFGIRCSDSPVKSLSRPCHVPVTSLSRPCHSLFSRPHPFITSA